MFAGLQMKSTNSGLRGICGQTREWVLLIVILIVFLCFFWRIGLVGRINVAIWAQRR